MRNPRVGDIVLIEKNAHFMVIGHYLVADRENGPFVQFFRCSVNWTPSLGFEGCEPLFPPLLVGIGYAVRTGRWSVIGNVKPARVQIPRYLMQGPGDTWFLFEGGSERMLGTEVAEELQDLETLSVWSPEMIEERIRSGINPFSYQSRRRWK